MSGSEEVCLKMVDPVATPSFTVTQKKLQENEGSIFLWYLDVHLMLTDWLDYQDEETVMVPKSISDIEEDI